MMIVALSVGLVVYVVKRRSSPRVQQKEDDDQANVEEVNLNVIDTPFPQIIP